MSLALEVDLDAVIDFFIGFKNRNGSAWQDQADMAGGPPVDDRLGGRRKRHHPV